MTVKVSTGAAASNSSVLTCKSADAGSKSVSSVDKEMEVDITSIPTHCNHCPITKSCHEPTKWGTIRDKSGPHTDAVV